MNFFIRVRSSSSKLKWVHSNFCLAHLAHCVQFMHHGITHLHKSFRILIKNLLNPLHTIQLCPPACRAGVDQGLPGPLSKFSFGCHRMCKLAKYSANFQQKSFKDIPLNILEIERLKSAYNRDNQYSTCFPMAPRIGN